MATSGIINGTVSYKSAYFSFYIEWSAIQSVEGNYSDLTVSSYVATNNTQARFDTEGTRQCWISIGDDKETITQRIVCNPWDATKRKQLQSRELRVYHDSDGTKSIKISAFADCLAASYGPKDCNASATVTLTTIPRKSSVEATTANIGEQTTISITRNSDSFKHTLSWGIGSTQPSSWTQIVSKTAEVSYKWTLPTSLYSNCPNDTYYRYVWFKCDTYSGNTLIGSNYCYVQANVREEGPTISGVSYSATDYSSLTGFGEGNEIILISGMSTVTVNASATAKNSAEISSFVLKYKNNNTKASLSNGTASLTKVTTGDFSLVATDSRGFSKTIDKSFSIVNYIKPSLVLTATRVSPTNGQIKITVKGNIWEDNFGIANNSYVVEYYWKIKNGSSWTKGTMTVPITVTETTYSGTLILPEEFNYTEAYTIRATIQDRLGSASKDEEVSKGVPVFDYGKDDFHFNVLATDKNHNDITLSEWTPLSLATGIFANSENTPVKYRTQGPHVWIIGRVRGVSQDGTLLFSIPSSIKPTTTHKYFINAMSGAENFYRMIVSNAGEVKMEKMSYGSHSESLWYDVSCNYFIDE